MAGVGEDLTLKQLAYETSRHDEGVELHIYIDCSHRPFMTDIMIYFYNRSNFMSSSSFEHLQIGHQCVVMEGIMMTISYNLKRHFLGMGNS